jgi:hypothetical protein
MHKHVVALVALLGLVSAPVHASVREAALTTSADVRSTQSGMFAGATLRVGFDRSAGKARGRAALAISGMTKDPGSAGVRFGDGFELAAGRTGKPALHVAGQDVGEFGRQNNLSTAAAIAIGVGLVVVVGAAVLLASKPWECRSDGAPCD